MKDTEHLNYLGFNLEYPRDKDLIDYFEAIDKGARSYMARQMLRLCIQKIGSGNILPTVLREDVKKHKNTPNAQDTDIKEEAFTRNDNQGNKEGKPKFVPNKDSEGTPTGLLNLMKQFGSN